MSPSQNDDMMLQLWQCETSLYKTRGLWGGGALIPWYMNALSASVSTDTSETRSREYTAEMVKRKWKKKKVLHSDTFSSEKAWKMCLNVQAPQLLPSSEFLWQPADEWTERKPGQGRGLFDQCALIGRRLNQSSPWGALEHNCDRLKCFVWVSPMACPCWLSVNQWEPRLSALFTLLQYYYSRTHFRVLTQSVHTHHFTNTGGIAPIMSGL